MPYNSTAPAAITALVKLFALACAGSPNPDVAGVKVQDGPEPDDAGATTGLFVGWTGWPADATQVDRNAADVRPVAAGRGMGGGMGGQRDREGATIHCAAQVLNQDSDMAAARALAYAIRDTAVGAVVNRSNLSGTVPGQPNAPGIQGIASAGATTLLQQRTANGALATVQFDIETDAFTT